MMYLDKPIFNKRGGKKSVVLSVDDFKNNYDKCIKNDINVIIDITDKGVQQIIGGYLKDTIIKAIYVELEDLNIGLSIYRSPFKQLFDTHISLEYIDILDPNNEYDLSAISKLHSLKTLKISNYSYEVNEHNMECIKSMTNLTELSLFGTSMYDINSMTNLQKLRLKFQNSSRFDNLINLTELRLNYTDDSMDHEYYFNIPHVIKFSNLTVLQITCAKIPYVVISTKIKYLKLEHCQINDCAIEIDMCNLNRLIINDVRIKFNNKKDFDKMYEYENWYYDNKDNFSDYYSEPFMKISNFGFLGVFLDLKIFQVCALN